MDGEINQSIHLFFTNEPLAGFKIDGTRRRWSTSNVLFEVTDPRGFNLQISAENMMLIINTIGIAKGGVIQGNCYWAFNQGKAFLCSDAEVPLAFAVDSTNNKTKLTVDGWRDKSINTSIFTNEPLAGFKIDGTRRRWSTSNVLFEVTDPRGFNLQISAENMMLIINTIGIAKGGVIQGNCYWAFNQGKAFLCSDAMGFTEQLLLKRSMKKYKTVKCQDCKVGDTFWSSDGFSKITYMGITYVHSKGISGKLLVKQQHTLKINDELYYQDSFSSIKQIDSVEVDLNELIRVYREWRVFHYQVLSGFELSYEPNHRGDYVYQGEWYVSIKGKAYKLTDVFEDWPYVSPSTPYTRIISDETYYQVLSNGTYRLVG
jgi:hypothetical protein